MSGLKGVLRRLGLVTTTNIYYVCNITADCIHVPDVSIVTPDGVHVSLKFVVVRGDKVKVIEGVHYAYHKAMDLARPK